jgi:phosphoglycolate phosphatase-like HAD superfamily hydrolase
VKAIVFDIDGTLIDSMSIDTEQYFLSIEDVLGPVEIRPDLTDYDHVTDTGILTQLVEDNGRLLDPEEIATIQSVFVERLKRAIEDEGPFRAIDGAAEYFGKVRERTDTRVAIATGGWRRSAMLKLKSAGFNIDGTHLVTSDDASERVEIMRLAIARLGEDFESITYFGDAEWDRLACRYLGWNFVAVGPRLAGIESYAGFDI